MACSGRRLTTSVGYDATPSGSLSPKWLTVLAARILAEIGDDLSRFSTATGLLAFAGTAPVTRASGRSRYVKARPLAGGRCAAPITSCPCALRQAPRRRRPLQRRPEEPREQAPRQPVVAHSRR